MKQIQLSVWSKTAYSTRSALYGYATLKDGDTFWEMRL